jgi:hypothetical protein
MNYELWKKNKKITSVLIMVVVLCVSFSPIFAAPAHAQWVVWDPGNFATNVTTQIKDYGLDAIAWTLSNLIIERMTASTVNWINSGFKGSPAFITNPEAYFTNIGDQIAGQYIFSNPNLNFLCGPISAKIKLALAKSYTGAGNQNWQCTLTQAGKNMDNFMNGFENGGWDSFFQVSQNTQMNPIGAYLQAQNEMNLQIATKQGAIQADLAQGKGFLSYQKCKEGTERTAGQLRTCDTDYNTCINNNRGDENNLQQCASIYKKCDASSPAVAVGDCADKDKETVTPGSVIADQLNTSLNTGTNKLVTADELNEIVGALLNQVVSQVVGGVGNGLRGLSQPNTSSGGTTFTSQLSGGTAASTVDYFGNAQDTSEATKPTVMPLDRDCLNIPTQTLNQMAQQYAAEKGITLEQALVNLDCPPLGIH